MQLSIHANVDLPLKVDTMNLTFTLGGDGDTVALLRRALPEPAPAGDGARGGGGGN